jgi:dihydroorotase
MVDFGSANPPLSLETLCMEKFRPGDIYTHMYGGGEGTGRQSVVDENGKLRLFTLEAQKRGVIFDVGHGGASFLYKNAIPAIKQGLKPNTISTDSHGRSVMAGMKDMTNVMSKFLNMGMTVSEIIRASTWAPANAIKRPELGHLSEGAGADVTVFSVRNGNFGFLERAGGTKMSGNQKIEAELTLRAGKVMWDLNGISAPEWKSQ